MTNGEQTIVEIRLNADRGAPYLARRMVAAATSAAPSVRELDITLLTSELVSARVAEGEAETVTVVLVDSGRSIRVEVGSPGAGGPGADDLITPILDRLATRWGESDATTWFEVEWISKRTLDGLDEHSLFGLLPDHAARSEIFERYLGFSTALARRFTRSRVAFDDLEQVAAMALVKAIDRFDPDYGAKFTTFAGETIKGELKRHLRDSSWSMRVPRGLQEASLEVRRAEDELGQRLGRKPTAEEVAVAIDADLADVEEALRAGQAYSAFSLDAPLNDDEDGISLAAVLGVEDAALGRVDAWHAVEEAMAKLPERERQILYLRFFEDMSQSEIAEEVGVSQMHVSRLLARSISEIKSEIGAEAASD
ncbi:MAG TPA: SigB/SigF/SigG family RNA polymerase sigma factor [Acidimicrobiia bacterium]|nr:SigB/SigF/SigG family RNA polymerase sigma factor [Acidimicrobiia bacterium]